VTTATPTTPVAFTACDRCSARAAVEACNTDLDMSLNLCQHHADKHLPALEAKGWNVTKLET
jgi:hypothetical protein